MQELKTCAFKFYSLFFFLKDNTHFFKHSKCLAHKQNTCIMHNSDFNSYILVWIHKLTIQMDSDLLALAD